jgi:hypothetical protein
MSDSSQRASTANDIGAIEKTIWTYLDGLHEGDTAKLGNAFHEVSHLYSPGPDGVQDLPRAKWFEFVAGRASPKSKGLPRADRIISIDLSGPETAFVKLECCVPPRYFTDYLLLIKTGAGWRIVSKSYRTDMRE